MAVSCQLNSVALQNMLGADPIATTPWDIAAVNVLCSVRLPGADDVDTPSCVAKLDRWTGALYPMHLALANGHVFYQWVGSDGSHVNLEDSNAGGWKSELPKSELVKPFPGIKGGRRRQYE